jgi:hypothetical protein
VRGERDPISFINIVFYSLVFIADYETNTGYLIYFPGFGRKKYSMGMAVKPVP